MNHGRHPKSLYFVIFLRYIIFHLILASYALSANGVELTASGIP